MEPEAERGDGPEPEAGKRELRVGELYESSLKFLLVAALELYLSVMLVTAFFQCSAASCTEAERDQQDLQMLYTFSWPPVLAAVLLVYSPLVLRDCGPSRDNFDRDVMRLKILMWVVTLVDMVVDDDMELKRGPGLSVAALFCVADMLRFLMDMNCLVEDEQEQEEEIDRLANLVIEALEDNQRDTAFKHAVRSVMERNRLSEDQQHPQHELEIDERQPLSPAYQDELERPSFRPSDDGDVDELPERLQPDSPPQLESTGREGAVISSSVPFWRQPLSRSQYSL